MRFELEQCQWLNMVVIIMLTCGQHSDQNCKECPSLAAWRTAQRDWHPAGEGI